MVCSTAAHILLHLPQLRRLDLSFKPEDLAENSHVDPCYDARVEYDSEFAPLLTSAISQLPQLRYFRCCRALLEMNENTSPFSAALPETLQELLLAHAPVCSRALGADLAHMTQLKTLNLMFDSPGIPLQVVQQFSSLQLSLIHI